MGARKDGRRVDNARTIIMSSGNRRRQYRAPVDSVFTVHFIVWASPGSYGTDIFHSFPRVGRRNKETCSVEEIMPVKDNL